MRIHSNVINESRLDVQDTTSVSWDVECCIPEPPSTEPRRRHSRRVSGEGLESDDEAESPQPRRVFVDETEDADEDLFGDPDEDLAISDDSDEEEAADDDDGGGA